MQIIDRYLLRQFLWVLMIFFCSFMGLYVVADLVNNYDELSNHASKHGGILRVLFEYYGQRSLSFFDQTSPLLILIASMFTVAAFRRHNEMTALMAAGISKGRIVRPILLAAAALTFFAALNRELFIPMVRDKLSYNAQDLSEVRVREMRSVYDNQTDVLLSGAGVILLAKEIDKPNFFLPRGLDTYGRQLTAKRAHYVRADSQHPGGYILTNVQQPTDMAHRASLSLGNTAVVVTPRDATWLKPDECFVASQVDFEQLSGGQFWRQYSSTLELISGMHNPSLDYGAGVRVAIHARLVRPFLDLTLLMLGLPLVLTRENRNLFLAVGLCVVVVGLFMLITMGCHYLGENLTINPALAAWCPLLIAVPVAVGMSERLRE